MSYLADYANAQNGGLLQKIQEAICSTALDIQSEATNTALHAQRSAWALLVLQNPTGYAAMMAYAMCADGAIDTSSTDSAIKTRASSVWNAFAAQT